jgi:hypothetical protein
MDEKVLLALISVFVGWLLAQLSGIVKDRLTRRRIRKCLLEELQELQIELNHTLLKYARQLQVHALQGIDNNVPLPLSNHIFRNYYKDAVLSFSQTQRMSYQLIHSQLEQLNAGIRNQEEVTRRLHEKARIEGPQSINKAEGELWGQTVVAGFTNAATVLWHVDYHLGHPRHPELSLLTGTHEAHLKYCQNVETQIQDILEKGKSLSREDFIKIYRPEDFLRKTVPDPKQPHE